MANPGLIAAAQSVGGFASNLFFGKRQHNYNMKMAQFQKDAQEQYLRQQLDYNTPKNQMARYQEAGLNPNLVYGQGNPGNQSAPLPSPDYGKVDFQQMANNPIEMFNQSRLLQSQIQAVDANVVKTQNQSALAQLQASVLAKNPLLNATGYNAIIDALKSTAESKSAQAQVDTQKARFLTRREWKNTGGMTMELDSNGNRKMQLELDLLEQKFKLGSVDQNIKAQILNSKEFQNEILEVQKRFMTEADITPQHILQFIQLLLMKLL